MSWRARVREWLYSSCPGFAGAFPYHRTRVFFPKGSILFTRVCHSGYERENVRLLCMLARDGGTVFDVGANIGLMAIPVLRYCPKTRVVSFEPSPKTLEYLRKTVAGSAYVSRWDVVDQAACEQEGTLEFFVAAESQGAYDGLADTARGGPMARTSVRATTLDLEWTRLGKPKIAAIKIDTEGAELRVLRGANDCIRAQHPPILLEWNAVNLKAARCEPQELLTFARASGYGLYAMPALTRIDAPEDLALQMLLSETFLLWARQEAR